MKILSIMLLTSFVSMSSVFAGDVITVKKVITETIKFKKLEKKSFEMITNESKGMVESIINGQVQSHDDVEATNNDLKLNLEVTGKNIVKFSSSTHANFNREVEAQIEKSLLGNVKKIVVSGQALPVLVKSEADDQMIRLIRQLGSIFGSVSYTNMATDLVCTSNEDLLECKREKTEIAELTTMF